MPPKKITLNLNFEIFQTNRLSFTKLGNDGYPSLEGYIIEYNLAVHDARYNHLMKHVAKKN